MRLISLIFLAALAACSTGKVIFNQGKLMDKLNGPREVNDESIKRAMDAKPQLTPGFRLAIHMPDPNEQWNGQPWSAADRERVMQMVRAACNPRFCKDTVEITAIEGNGDKLFVRQAAAERGAQAVLWIRGIQDVQIRDNGRAWTNLLILPAFFIESEDVYSYFLASAQMLDVGNGYMYVDVQTVGRAKTKQTPAENDSKLILKQARSGALDQLIPALEKTFVEMSLSESKKTIRR